MNGSDGLPTIKPELRDSIKSKDRSREELKLPKQRTTIITDRTSRIARSKRSPGYSTRATPPYRGPAELSPNMAEGYYQGDKVKWHNEVYNKKFKEKFERDNGTQDEQSNRRTT